MKTKNLEEFLKEHGVFEEFCKNCYLGWVDEYDLYKPCTIKRAFAWIGTPEGFNFWEKLQEEVEKDSVDYSKNIQYFYNIGKSLVNQNNTKETQMKTKSLEEFLKEHGAFEAFCKNCYLYSDLDDVELYEACTLGFSFIWAKTPEGFAFWLKLEEEIQNYDITYYQNVEYFYKIGEALVNQNNSKETQRNEELPQEPFGLQKAIELMLQGHKVSLTIEPRKYFVFINNYFHKVRPDGQSFGADMNYYSNDSFVLYKEPSVPQGTPEVVTLEKWLVRYNSDFLITTLVEVDNIDNFCYVHGYTKVKLISKSEITLGDSD